MYPEISKRLGAFLGVGLLMLASPATAGGKDGRFALEDAGRAKCSTYVKAREAKSDSYTRYVGFIEGYLTAANRYEPNTFDLTPWHTPDALALILDQHCRQDRNKDQMLGMVAQHLVVAMQPLRLADYSDLIEVREGTHRTRVYSTILRRAQMELTRRGLFHGTADGKFSPETKAALQQFQQTTKLDPTGVPDVATLWVLLNP